MSDYSSLRLLPSSVIQAAKAGDAEAIGTVLHYYDGYMNSLCQRRSYTPDGQYQVVIDQYMKRRLEIKLITAIVTMKY